MGGSSNNANKAGDGGTLNAGGSEQHEVSGTKEKGGTGSRSKNNKSSRNNNKKNHQKSNNSSGGDFKGEVAEMQRKVFQVDSEQ